ncbi:ankyrin repeat-containing domain protein [Apiospora saccharicola]|uniref:Ankyrin repeat-containing domain protein n=1 Tax=Apiospora saccharicola TaxID=335842 RepID=A0ABR1UEP1_9PEZI
MAEALGLGANVVAFVVVAAQLAKKTHETFSAIKDGPEIVQRVASQVNQVYWILEGLKKHRAALEDPALAGHLQICFNEISSAAALIEKLQLSPAERRGGRLWKRLRTFLNEKDLERLNAQLTGIATTLTLRMQGASSTQLHGLHEKFTVFERRIDTLHQSVQTQTRSYATDQAHLAESVNRTTGGHFDSLQHSLLTMQNESNNHQAISQTKLDELLAGLKSLLVHKKEEGNRSTQGSVSEETESDDARAGTSLSTGNGRTGSEELIQKVESLCRLLSHEGQTIDTYNEDAANIEICDRIIEDLQAILNLAAEQGEVSAPRKSSTDAETSDRQDAKAIARRLKRAFGQQTLQINQRSLKRQKPTCGMLKTSRSYTTIKLDIGTMTLAYAKRQHCFTTDLTRPSLTDYAISATFLPADPSRFHMIVATAIQEQGHLGVLSSISSLSVNRVVPSDSRVFDVVEAGDLDELKDMLNKGEASLRDHDESGGSLLMVCIYYSAAQPSIYRFLIQQGLDVDHVGKKRRSLWYDGPMCVLSVDSYYNHEPILLASEALFTYRRLLLEGGADPTLQYDDRPDCTYIYDVCQSGNKNHLLQAFNSQLTGHFVNVNMILPDGLTPLLALCKRDFGCKLELVETLVSMGADITARDNMGRNCLHMRICNLYGPWSRREHDNIRYLTSQGADPEAIDDQGFSVSDIAYEAKLLKYNTTQESSYAGDLWDSVLQSCGYNIADFRCVHRQRKARYDEPDMTYGYGRINFERLWRGREQFCPYWDDEPWPRADERDACLPCPRCGKLPSRDSDDEGDSENESDAETDSSEGECN